VKVGYRQASYTQKPAQYRLGGLFAFQRIFSRYACNTSGFPTPARTFSCNEMGTAVTLDLTRLTIPQR
jgi:hypothetical protein